MPETPNRMTLGELLRASNQVLGMERVGRVINTPQQVQEDIEQGSFDGHGFEVDDDDPFEDVSEETPPQPPRPGDPGFLEYVLEIQRSRRRAEEGQSDNVRGSLQGGWVVPPPIPRGTQSGARTARLGNPITEWRSLGDEGMVWTGDTVSTRANSWPVEPPAMPRATARPIAADIGSSPYNHRANPVTNNDLEEYEMRTVGSIVGREPDISSVTTHPLVLGLNRVGVEIEVEQFTNRRHRLRYWNMVSDGSLRNNGQEFTFRGALGGKDAFDAISEIDTLLYQSNPDLNIRCSTHVHVDVRDMTVPQLKKMILAYAFYESFLFAQSGRHRMKSNFCMPLCIAEGLTHILMDYWRYDDADFVFQVTDRWDKYSAMNLIPIRSYGSVEFRIAEGKSKSGQLLRLVNRFLALKEVAIANDDKDDRQFLDFLRETDYRNIFRKGVRNQVVFSEEDFKTGWVIANDIATLGKMR